MVWDGSTDPSRGYASKYTYNTREPPRSRSTRGRRGRRSRRDARRSCYLSAEPDCGRGPRWRRSFHSGSRSDPRSRAATTDRARRSSSHSSGTHCLDLSTEYPGDTRSISGWTVGDALCPIRCRWRTASTGSSSSGLGGVHLGDGRSGGAAFPSNARSRGSGADAERGRALGTSGFAGLWGAIWRSASITWMSAATAGTSPSRGADGECVPSSEHDARS